MVFCLCFLGICFGSLGSFLLYIHENSDELNLKTFFSISKCKKCKKKLNIKGFLPIIGFFFKKNNCLLCRKRIFIITPILEILSALIFCIVYFYHQDGNFLITVFWMLSGWVLLMISVSDLLRYEIHLPLIVLGGLIVIMALLFGLFDVSCLRGALVFLLIFIILYYGALIYTKIKYGMTEEGVGMGDLIISPYLGVLLYMGIPSIYTEELVCSILVFFILTSVLGLFVYLIQNVFLGKKPSFLPKEMSDRSLPLIPSMVISLVVVIICHDVLFEFLLNIGDSFIEKMVVGY